MRALLLAGTSLRSTTVKAGLSLSDGMTLIELVIVVAVMGILLATAIPSYRSYTLRVHRTEAIRMLLQASMCQEKLIASRGKYDTNLCRPASEQKRYQLSYNTPNSQGLSYLAMATPLGAQIADPCGSLILDHSGARSISASNISTVKCWSGR